MILSKIDWDNIPLGDMSDLDISFHFDLPAIKVRRVRLGKGIPRYKKLEHARRVLEETGWMSLLKKGEDRELSERTVFCQSLFVRLRKVMGIRCCREKPTDRTNWGNVNWELSNRHIAKEVGRHPTTVYRERERRGIPSKNSLEKNKWDALPLGKFSDGALAERLGVSVGVVRHQRCKRTLPSYRDPEGGYGVLKRLMETKGLYKFLGKWTDAKVAASAGIAKKRVTRLRNSLGIVSELYHPTKNIDWDAQPLGEIPDIELAKRCEVSCVLVGSHRKLRGIPAYRRGG